MISPASTTTVSPLRSDDAGTFSSPLPLRNRRAMVSWRILRKVAACALPRPSATASAKLAKTTVNQSQKLTFKVNQSGCVAAVGAKRSRSRTNVVSTLPISTTNITGFLITWRGASLRKLSHTAGPMISGSKSERSFRRVSAAMLVNLSCLSQKVFDDGPEGQSREESQRADDDDDADEQHHKQPPIGRKSAQTFGHGFLTD